MDRSEAERKLRDLIPDGSAARGIETETEILEAADEAKAINEAAERFEADIVCVGSHGRGGILNTVLGSVAGGVLARCLRPVLVVRSLAE